MKEFSYLGQQVTGISFTTNPKLTESTPEGSTKIGFELIYNVDFIDFHIHKCQPLTLVRGLNQEK